MKGVLTGGLAALFAFLLPGTIPESLRAGLRSPSAEERAAAVMELASAQEPDQEVLELVADALADPVEDVRLAAAYGVPRLAVKWGCELNNLAECKQLLGVVEPPAKLSMVGPSYPDRAKRAGLEGSVVIQCLVRETGALERVAAMSGPDVLRGPALEAFKRWTYRPAMRQGKAVPLAMTVKVNFLLR